MFCMQKEGIMIHLITGGSGSGKSAYAEEQILSYGENKRIYIATMHPFDSESLDRIARHRKMRKAKNFETIECYTGLKKIEVPENSDVLLECMSNLTSNEIFDPEGAGFSRAEEEIWEGIQHLTSKADHLVIVTNEIFSDGVSYEQETEEYQKILGHLNCRIADLAELVTEVVYGIPVRIKG